MRRLFIGFNEFFNFLIMIRFKSEFVISSLISFFFFLYTAFVWGTFSTDSYLNFNSIIGVTVFLLCLSICCFVCWCLACFYLLGPFICQ